MPESKFIMSAVAALAGLCSTDGADTTSHRGSLSTRDDVSRAVWLSSQLASSLTECASSLPAGHGDWVQVCVSGRRAEDAVRIVSALGLAQPHGAAMRVLASGHARHIHTVMQVCRHMEPECVDSVAGMVGAVTQGWTGGAQHLQGRPPRAHLGIRVVRAGDRLDGCLAFGSVLEAKAQNLCGAQMIYVCEGESAIDAIEHISRAGYQHRETADHGLRLVALA